MSGANPGGRVTAALESEKAGDGCEGENRNFEPRFVMMYNIVQRVCDRRWENDALHSCRIHCSSE